MYKLVPIIILISTAYLFTLNIDSLKNELLKDNSNDAKYSASLELADYYQGIKADSSLFYAKLIDNYTDNDSLKIYESKRQLGNTYHRLGKYPLALENYEIALAIAKSKLDTFRLIDSHNDFGYLYMDINENEKSGDNFYVALDYLLGENSLTEKRRNLKLEKVYSNFARYLEAIGNMDSAIIIRKDAIRLAKKTKSQKIVIFNYVNLAGIFNETGVLDSAKYYYEVAVKETEKSSSIRSKSFLYLNYGIFLGSIGEYDPAEKYIKLSQPFFKKTEPQGLLASYESLIKLYREKDNKDSLIEYQRLYYELKDSLSLIVSKAKIEELSLTKENEMMSKIIEEHQKQSEIRDNLYVASAILFLVLIFLTIILLRNNSKEKQRSSELSLLNTELDDAVQKLQLNEKELRSLNNTKDKFFSIIAHDLKNPVSAISSSLDFINKNFEHFEKEELQDFISDSSKQSIQLFNLLNNLLAWSRSQRGLVEIHKEEIEVDILMSLILGTCEGMANKKNISLRLIRSELTINSDKNLIDTIIRNLVSNSIKFTPENGSIKVSSEFSNDKILVHVEDTGTGIPESKLSGLFSLDTNSSEDGTSGEKGTSLGLVLCEEFAQKLGGFMSVTSQMGKGSKFTLTIPIS